MALWLALLVGIFSLGRLLAGPIGAAIGPDSVDRMLLTEGVLGFGLVGSLAFLLAVFGRFGILLVVVVLTVGSVVGFVVGRAGTAAFPVSLSARSAGLLFIVLPAVLLALYPETGFDSSNYHLPISSRVVADGGVQPILELRFPVFPLLGEMWFALALLFDERAGEATARLLHLSTALLLAWLVFDWSRRRALHREGRVETAPLAVGLVLGTPLVWSIATMAYVDVALALFVTFALYCWWMSRLAVERSGLLVMTGLALGWACAIKYLGGFFALLVVLAELWRWVKGRRARDFVLLVTALLVSAGPFYLYIVSESGNPVFPFYESMFGASEWSPKSARVEGQGSVPGSAAEWIEAGTSLLLVPFDTVFRRERYSNQAPGSPFWLVLLPLALLWGRRSYFCWEGAIVALYSLFWLTTVRDPRFLLPILPLLGILTIECCERHLPGEGGRDGWRRAPLLGFVLLTPGLLWAVLTLVDRGPLPLSSESRQAYLDRELPGHGALRWLDLQHEEKYCVYGLFAEDLRYHAEGQMVGDWFGPWRYDRFLETSLDSPDVHPLLVSIQADYLLVRGKESRVAPSERYALVHEGEQHRLYAVPREDGQTPGCRLNAPFPR